MTRTVQALEQAGLVRRREGDDRRTTLITATPPGRRLLGRARKRRVDRLARALRELPAGELVGLDRAATVIERVSHD
jgi:DNA-binding MarR family transcriptional regulator